MFIGRSGFGLCGTECEMKTVKGRGGDETQPVSRLGCDQSQSFQVTMSLTLSQSTMIWPHQADLSLTWMKAWFVEAVPHSGEGSHLGKFIVTGFLP